MRDELITIATYGTLPEADAARLYLEAEGITTFLADAETVAMGWLLANAIGNIKLQVSPLQKDAAVALLEQMRVRKKERDENPGDDSKSSCLACGADLPKKADRCTECGWTWLRVDGAYNRVETADGVTPEIDINVVNLDPKDAAERPANTEGEQHERATSDEERSLNLDRVRWEVVAVLFLGIFTTVFYAVYARFDPRPASTFAGDMLMLIANSLQIAIPLLYIMWRSGQPWHHFGVVRFRPIFDPVAGIGLLFFVLLPFLFLFAPFVVTSRSSYYEASNPYQLLLPSSGFDYALLVVAMCVNAINEELLVRGYLIPRLRHCGMSSAFAVLISSFLWAAYHVYAGVDWSVVIFGEGIILGTAFILIRRLWPLVIAHALWGLISYCAS